MSRIPKPAVPTTALPAATTGGTTVDIVNVRRRQGRSIATRQKILNAALQEFAALTFDGATTRSIADRAGVPHGLVIYHFETKLGAWQAVMERALNELHDRFLRTIKESEGEEPHIIVRSIYSDFIRTSAAKPELGWLFSHEFSGQSSRFHWLHEQIRARDLDITLDIIRRAQATGHFVQGDPAHLHFLFVGAATRVFGLAPEIERHVGVSPFNKRFIERHVELCLSLFFPASRTEQN